MRCALLTIINFFIHLGYSFNFTVVYLCHVMGGIPPPRGQKPEYPEKNHCKEQKGGSPRVKWGPLYLDPTVIPFNCVCAFWLKTHDTVIILRSMIVTTLIIFSSFLCKRGAQRPNTGQNIKCLKFWKLNDDNIQSYFYFYLS